MSKPTVESTAPLALTLEQLTSIVNASIAANASNNAAQLDALVNAIVESRKPFVDPKAAENEEEFRRGIREQERRKKDSEKASQDACTHEKGSTGSFSYGESAFWVLTLDTGETIGVCSQCQKVITSLNPEHVKFFRMKGSNQPAHAGRGRMFLNPLKAQTARLAPDERAEIESKLNIA